MRRHKSKIAVLATILGSTGFYLHGSGLPQLSQLARLLGLYPGQGTSSGYSAPVQAGYPTSSQGGYPTSAPGGYPNSPPNGYPNTTPSVPNYNAGYNPSGQLPPLPTIASSSVSYGGQPQILPQQGGPAIRIASFNIQVFGDSKASKTYVMQTLAAIIRNFQIVAIQEIRTKNDYLLDNFLRDYVNQGAANQSNAHIYDYVIGPRLGRTNSKEQYAFIYDTAMVELNKQSVYTVNDPQDLFQRSPLVAMFRARGPAPNEAFTFILVDIHTEPDEALAECNTLADVYHAVRQASGGEDDVIIMGDLNADDRHLGRLAQIPGIHPIVSGVFSNTRQNALYDNFIIHQPSTTEFTGRWGVFDVMHQFNLSQDQALQVSDHFPIWAEFSVYEGATPGRVAGLGGAQTMAPMPATR
ncbi:MAG TPA: endonuclease/exonuclease/phosphatase family protein [Lacipirellulaceae bacterium]